MQQTKVESAIESTLNVLSGTLASLCIWIFIVKPVWNIETNMTDNLAITGIFTLSALLRSFLWRRFFNRGLHKVVHNWVSNYTSTIIELLTPIKYNWFVLTMSILPLYNK